MGKNAFQQIVYSYYQENKRILPWRWEPDPYKIFVSEVMLQQTQVSRVQVKYPEFIKRFPTFTSLAHAPLSKVLSVWQGMGYNRRGKYLKESAEKVVRDKEYAFLCQLKRPQEAERSHEISRQARNDNMWHDLPAGEAGMIAHLQKLPGVGYATACAIVTYSFNIPTVFVETNIRAAYLYHFFPTSPRLRGTNESIIKVSDKDILDKIEKTLDTQYAREWYYALTDYGAMLKKKKRFQNVQSAQYTKQSTFEGSRRQIRGRILKIVLASGPVSLAQVKDQIASDDRVDSVVNELVKEKLITINKNKKLSIF